MLQQKKGWGKNVIVMYTCKDNLIPLLYSGKIKKIFKKKEPEKEPNNIIEEEKKAKQEIIYTIDKHREERKRRIRSL